ncbi:MAG: heavy metal sensor histidine kinase [Rubrivivax sp.]|nr:heavy metal sensor histidine kinase [Rubrivivax sp.]
MSPPAHGPGRRAPSVGRRLSTWLALQGLLVALLVSTTVIAVSYWVLQSRQKEELQVKTDVIRHALSETAEAADLTELRHKLDDFLVGHEDMALTVRTLAGQVLFAPARTRRVSSNDARLRAIHWQDTWPSSPVGRVMVDLTLDVGRDDALLWRLGVTLVVASLAGAGIVGVTGYMLVARGLRPVRRLSSQVESMALDRAGLRLDGSGQPQELTPLVQRFNDLLTRVEQAYAQLEGFNADVAHELRTPLTTLIGSSELALQRDRPADELREVIAANLEDLRRLAVIVNDMLFLSQADRGAPARRERVDSLCAALHEIVDYHEAALLERNLTAVCQGDAAGLFDISLIRRALSNLLSNATRYATPGSVVRVQIEALPGQVRISVVNEGPLIDAEHLPKLFDRFYRVDRSRRRSGANYGLGLAIVAAIARMHRGEPFAQSDRGVTSIGLHVPSAEPFA